MTTPPDETENVRIEQDPLHLGLEDDRLITVINQRIEASQKYYKDLSKRQKRILDYLSGKQVDKDKIDEWSLPYMENVVFEAQMRNKPIALSRLPDLKAKPGNKTPESKKTADMISDIINSDIRKRDNRKTLGMAYNQRPVGLFSIIKARWNPELGSEGDYEFVNVHYSNVVMDHTCPVPDPQKMEFFAERAELSVKQIIMMFPDKKEDFLKYLNLNKEKTYDEQMATKLRIWEVWFHWYEEEEEPTTQEKKWVKIHGVVWKYQNFLLGKMKNPYWDWEGEKRYFSLQMNEDKELSEEDIYTKMFGEETDTIFRNYFKNPQKPYFVMSYFRSGVDPVDFTSEYEQVLDFQDAINAEGQQIFDMNSRTKGKFVFAAQKIDKTEVEKLDLHNYNQAIIIDSDNANHAATILRGDPAPRQLYESKQENRAIAFEMMALNATTRGVRERGDETLGARQMMREQDFGVIDDVVEETINPAAEWMASWAMQFIKLFYTKPHLRRLLGKDGEVVHVSITQDLIEDGIEIEVSASGVDKVKRERKAMEDAKLQMIDPLSYYEAMNEPNARERARRLMIFQLAPQLYYTQIVEEQEIPPSQPTQPPIAQL